MKEKKRKNKLRFIIKYILLQLLFNPLRSLFIFMIFLIIIQKIMEYYILYEEIYKVVEIVIDQKQTEEHYKQLEEKQEYLKKGDLKEIEQESQKQMEQENQQNLEEKNQKEKSERDIEKNHKQPEKEDDKQLKKEDPKEIQKIKETQIKIDNKQKVTLEDNKIKDGPDLDFFTKKEIERIVKDSRRIAEDRAIADIIEMQEKLQAIQGEEYNFMETQSQIKKIIKPVLETVNEDWDLNLNTMGILLDNFASARVSANYNGDIFVLMNFVSANLPEDLHIPLITIDQIPQSLNEYLFIFEDNLQYLSYDCTYEYKFYKISVLTYLRCLNNNILHDPEEVQEIFDQIKDLLL